MQAMGGFRDCSDQSQDWRANGSRNLPQGAAERQEDH